MQQHIFVFDFVMELETFFAVMMMKAKIAKVMMTTSRCPFLLGAKLQHYNFAP